jgi:hypothetical protein
VTRSLTSMPPDLDGWCSTDARGADGVIESTQRVRAPGPFVEPSHDGARRLGRAYWAEVRRASHGLVRCRESDRGVELLALGLRPALLTFEPAQLAVESKGVSCSYRIAGGLLARRAGGTLTLTQTSCERDELRVTVTGFLPRLGMLYGPFELRVHHAVSRRYFRRLAREAGR